RGAMLEGPRPVVGARDDPRRQMTATRSQTSKVIGQNLSRGPGAGVSAGAFTSEPRGDWIATKVFVGDDAAEFYLNLNSKEGSGEISIKDPEYGDAALRELSRAF